MMSRFAVKPLVSIASVATLISLGTVAGVQQIGTLPAAAAGSSVGVLSWGDNCYGQLGNGSFDCSSSPQPAAVLLPSGVTPTAIAGGNASSTVVDPVTFSPAGFAIGSDGNVYGWGGPPVNSHVGDNAVPVVIPLPSGVKPEALSAGQGAAFVIGSDGHLYAWGDNTLGILGDGTTTSSTTPVQVSLPTGVTPTSIAAGLETAYAIGSDGHLYAWGDNVYGELGDGGVSPQTCTIEGSITGGCSTTPVQVSLPAGVTPTAISAGGGFALVLGSDGNLYAWGVNNVGQLGDGGVSPQTCFTVSVPCSTTPVQVSLPAGVNPTTISGGGGSAYAIGSNGNLYAWGYNADGELGNGTTTESTTPVQVSFPTGVTPTAISGGGDQAYAIGSNGNLYAWGADGSGQLGDGSTVNETTPVTVALPSGSTVQKLGPEPDADSGYVIVSALDVAPSVTTQPSSQNVEVGTGITFTAAASGFPGVTVQWQVSTDGGSTWSNISGATTDTLTETTTLSENGDEYRAVFTNSVGSVTSDPATLTVTAPPPPTTSVLVPSNGDTVSSGVWLDAAASSSTGIASVSFEVSGGSIIDQVVSSSGAWVYGYLGAWDTTDVPNGTYTLQSVATDTLGQSTTSAPITVTVDNLPLHTAVLVPSTGATLSGTAGVLDASAAGTTDVTSVQFEVTGGSLTDQVVGTATATIYGWIALFNTTSVPNGTYTLQSVATEVGGTTATSPGITVTVQN